VAASSGDITEVDCEAIAAGDAAGTVINSPQAGHFAKAKARESVVVSDLLQCGQLNSIATLRPRSSLRP
jgi:hypothetical protein